MMNKSLRCALSLIPFFMLFGVYSLLLMPYAHYPTQGKHDRYPASPGLSQAGCRDLAKDFLSSINRPAWKQFFEGKSRFNFALYREKVADYKELFAARELSEVLNENTAKPGRTEEVMAFIDALNETYRQAEVSRVADLPRKARKRLQRLANKMVSDKRVLWRDLESVVSEIYELNLGPRFKWRDFFKSDLIKQKAMTRVFQEDLAQRGLQGVLKKYKIFADKPNLIKDFMKSKKGEALKTSLFNLPMLFGAPPLYLPRLRPMRLTKELADDILMHGFGPEQMAKFEKSVRIGPLGVKGQARYEIMRKAYMLGATVYLSAAAMYEAYETDQVLEEEREILNQVEQEMNSDLDAAMELEQRGYSIFEDSENQRSPDPRCRLIESCFKQQGLKRPFLEHQESPQFRECVETLDPNGRCELY